MHPWLVDERTALRIRADQAAGRAPTMAEQLAYEARTALDASDGDPLEGVYKATGDRATITVRGILTDRRSWMAYYYGGGNTLYSQVVQSIARAEGDAAIKRIDLDVESPGGVASSGWLEMMEAIRDAKKPVYAYVGTIATSAAYGLVSQADKVIARNRMTYFGSVGVAVDTMVFPEDVSVTSTDAPKKRPDLATDEGRAILREELDSIHDIFAGMVAEGRGTTRDDINENYGQGATILAAEAVKRGMIDEVGGAVTAPVASSNPRNSITAPGGKKQEVHTMDLNELKAQHPEAYAAAVAQGREEAIATERDRVGAFLHMGEYSGDMKTAVEAIRAGKPLTMELSAQFMTAAANRGDQTRRTEDEKTTAAGADSTAPADPNASDDLQDKVVVAMERQFGVIDGGKK